MKNSKSEIRNQKKARIRKRQKLEEQILRAFVFFSPFELFSDFVLLISNFAAAITLPTPKTSMPRRLFHLPDHIFTDMRIAQIILIGGAQVIDGSAALDAVDDFAVAHAAI